MFWGRMLFWFLRHPRWLQLKQGSIQVAYAPSERGWLLLAMDLPSLLAAAGRTGFQEVRGLQLCATLSVRTVFTSDLAYSREVGCMPLKPQLASP